MNKSPGCFDSSFQAVCIDWSGVSHLHAYNTTERAYTNSIVIEPEGSTFGRVESSGEKWNQHLHKVCQQNEGWNRLKYPDGCFNLDLGKQSEPTAADDMGTKCHSPWKSPTRLQPAWILCHKYLLSSLNPDKTVHSLRSSPKFLNIFSLKIISKML